MNSSVLAEAKLLKNTFSHFSKLLLNLELQIKRMRANFPFLPIHRNKYSPNTSLSLKSVNTDQDTANTT